MRIIPDVANASESFDRLVLTVGCFDGIHRGHQAILSMLLEEARAIQGVAAVMTIEPHPRQFFSPENAPNILTHGPMKYRLLEELGVDVLYILPFDQRIATMSADTFVTDILVGKCRVAAVIMGHDFAFGHQAQGDYEFLRKSGEHLGFRTRQAPPLIIGGQRVSSTLIRERVVQGEVEHLDVYLGRPYALAGTVISGRGIGKTLGFPTINLDPVPYAIPAHGVYAAQARIDGALCPAAVNIGIAPTIRNEMPLVEAHLLEWKDGNLVGAHVELIFHKHMRPEKKFPSREALMEAIARDVAEVRNYLAARA